MESHEGACHGKGGDTQGAKPWNKEQDAHDSPEGETWNVRRLGAMKGSINQVMKMQCISTMCERRKRDFCFN